MNKGTQQSGKKNGYIGLKKGARQTRFYENKGKGVWGEVPQKLLPKIV